MRKTDLLKASDPGASLVAGLVGMAGALGLLSKWGISVDEAAAIIGFGGMVLAGARAWLELRLENNRDYETRKAVALAVDRTSIEELQEHIELRKLRELPTQSPTEPPEAA